MWILCGKPRSPGKRYVRCHNNWKLNSGLFFLMHYIEEGQMTSREGVIPEIYSITEQLNSMGATNNS